MTQNLQGKAVLTSDIVLVTGLHIGGSQSGIDIGGVDSPVIKTAEGQPYIPGSSLKGKLRSLMSRLQHKTPDHHLVQSEDNPIRIHMCEEPDCAVCSIFGSAAEKASRNTRLVVQDAYLDTESMEPLKEGLELEWTEVKWENSIDRITSGAHPRQIERVPAGSRFQAGFTFTVYENADLHHLHDFILTMRLLEDDYLGGSGTRGYGRIQWETMKLRYRTRAYYLGEEDRPQSFTGDTIDAFLEDISCLTQAECSG